MAESDRERPREADRSDRERVVAAFARAAAEQGYRGVTLERVARLARLPPDTVRSQFESVEDGLLAAQETFLDRLLLDVAEVCTRSTGEWAPRVRAAVGSVVASIAETSSLARAFSVEAGGAGLKASERWFSALDGFAELLENARLHAPRGTELPPSTERVIVGGVASIIADCLLAEDSRSLAELEPELVELILLPYLGAPEAKRIARGEQS